MPHLGAQLVCRERELFSSAQRVKEPVDLLIVDEFSGFVTGEEFIKIKAEIVSLPVDDGSLLDLLSMTSLIL